ncbi:CDP-diacylglycerol--serine O-phosphatidyltransferase [Sinobacterium caligoides]|uniref:CDP-diacylglycerol--serine O-phosphatidyltransferase n=1 Tax=Sinobacterium caligoides TaxID=933926 RepID=A0A3N2DKQ2_9GAMM|nr:CDP-diacylglycerol--serine O-phosphatidyltransferase [Sinobacterium caligoides]ROS00259.1 CDP-diacylglycerol--serine O-phosphatidyltransferase [Sinobacterium caligoides]
MLDELGGIKLQPDALRWLMTAKALKEELLTRIAAAADSIYITALYLEDDEAGREVLAALLAAKERKPSIDIKVFVDYHRARRGLIGQRGEGGNNQLYRQLMQQAEHPIEILGVPVKSREVMGVLHLKGFIIDDRVIYSGASINDIYLHQKDKYRIDRYHVIHSAELASTMREMIRRCLIDSPAVCSLCDDEASETIPDKASIRLFKHGLAKASYQFDGVTTGNRVTPLLGLGRKHNELNRVIVDMVRESRESLFICTPYFNPPYILARALSKHLRDGRRIDIVVGDKTANDFYIPPEKEFSTIGALPYMYEQTLRKFAKRQQWAIDKGLLNIHLWKEGGNSYHLKGVSADDSLHLLTGSNLNPRAWGLDVENGLLLHDESGVWRESFKEEQEHILQHAQRLGHYREVETLRNYPAPVRKVIKRIRRLKADLLLRKIL